MIYSYSRINTFKNCPFQFKLRYIDKEKPLWEHTAESILGNIVHEVLEKMYYDFKHGKINSLKETLQYFEKIWKKCWSENNIKIIKNYSRAEYKRLAERHLINYIQKFSPLSLSEEEKKRLKILDVEKKVSIALNGFNMIGFIDRLDYENGLYIINDYKTSMTLPSEDDMKKDWQLALYSIAIKKKFSTDKIKLRWYYINFDKVFELKPDFSHAEKMAIEGIQAIEKAEEFEPKPSALCDWCAYQHLCPLRKHLFMPEKKEEVEGEKLVEEYANLKIKEKKIKVMIDEMKEKIINYAEENDLGSVYGKNYIANVKIKEDIEFPSKSSEERTDLIRLLKKMGKWDNVEDLDVYALKSIILNKKWTDNEIERLDKFIKEKKIGCISLRKRENK
ncbi:PD-(D/E)XK nuclease family protein [Candidatus Woesearchaeota archaeon]|nr:PD-(D/E)XK nuclease family protein [Candidatus Woesearchaeota archaeon]